MQNPIQHGECDGEGKERTQDRKSSWITSTTNTGNRDGEQHVGRRKQTRRHERRIPETEVEETGEDVGKVRWRLLDSQSTLYTVRELDVSLDSNLELPCQPQSES